MVILYVLSLFLNIEKLNLIIRGYDELNLSFWGLCTFVTKLFKYHAIKEDEGEGEF